MKKRFEFYQPINGPDSTSWCVLSVSDIESSSADLMNGFARILADGPSNKSEEQLVSLLNENGMRPLYAGDWVRVTGRRFFRTVTDRYEWDGISWNNA